MKLSSGLLHAIALGISVSAFGAAAVSCQKDDNKKKNERNDDSRSQSDDDSHIEGCPACGMG